MKTLMSLGMMTLLIVTSCNEKTKKVNTETQDLLTVSTPTENPPDCYSDTQVTISIAKGWEEDYNIYKSENNVTGDQAIAYRYHFNTAQIRGLQSEADNWNRDTENENNQISGVIIYYGVTQFAGQYGDGPGFTLFMQNKLCVGSTTLSDPLIAWANIYNPDTNEQNNSQGTDYGGNSHDWYGSDPRSAITLMPFETVITNWETYRRTNFPEMPPIKGYNYSWEQIISGADNQGLSIHVGLKTITPEEGDSIYGFPNMREAGQVLCNIKYIGLPNAEYNGTELVDFAKPCPAYCSQ
jgi:hypothetical protein